jgi:hypothetical protein
MFGQMKKLKMTVVIALSCVAGVIVQTGVIGAETEQATMSVFVPVDSYRTFDTRTAMGNKLSAGSVNVVSPEFHLVDGDALALPPGTVAVAYNVTVTQTEGAGFLQIDALPIVDVETSSVNWFDDDQTVANSGITRIKVGDGGQLAFGVLAAGTDTARAHVVIDITGYFVET